MDYSSRKWKRKREVVLKLHEYLCQESKRFGKRVQATTVHHIYPAEFYPEIAWENWNLLPLTDANHNAMHDRDTHEITELGRYWQRKRQAEFERFYASPPPFEEIL